MKLDHTREKILVVAVRTHLSLPVAVGVSVAIALSGSSLAAAYPVDEPFRERPGSDHAASHRELLFVDPFVADPEQLLIALRPNVETIILEADRGGLEQITEALEQRRDVKAIHIVAHGEAGSLNLAGTTLTEASLSGASELLEGWFTDQPERPEILLYACDLARGPEGLAFIERLSSLAGADVAASTDLTGQGGDWELEYHLGEIATASAFNTGLIKGWSHTLATFTVTNTDDSGAGSLRQAIIDANAAPGEDTITFDAAVTGTITLTSNTELGVTDDLVITGPGAESLTVEPGNYYYHRVISANDADLEVEGITIANGRLTGGGYGGGMFFSNVSKDLILRDVTIRDSYTTGGGGGLFAKANSVLIEDSRITGNYGGDGGGGGALIDGDLTVINSTVSYNSSYYSAGGGIRHKEGDLTVINSSVSYNNANGGNGGGIHQDDFSATVSIANSVITNNSGMNGGGVWLRSSDVTLDGTKIAYNQAYRSSSGSGGGARIDADEILINNSQFLYNFARVNGGGLWVELEESEYLTIQDSTISNNYAQSDGGGIHIYFDDGGDSYTDAVVIRNTAITSNYAGGDGGGISVYADDAASFVKIFASDISDNQAGGKGGGIHFYADDDGSLFIKDSTISYNSADYGGGIWFYGDDGYLSVSNSTISHNSASRVGGGIAIQTSDEKVFIGTSTIVFNDANSTGGGIYSRRSVYVSSSIISENSAGAGAEIDIAEGQYLLANYSLLGTAVVVDSGANNIASSEAGVSPDLQDLGGPTQVHALSEDSAAVNASINDFDFFDFDQRGDGFPRVKGGRLDIGAFESDFGQVVVGVALNPTFGAPTSAADGFTVQISNYDADYEWAATSTAGTVAIDGDLLTVSGLTSGQSATVTVTTNRTDYAEGSADVTGSALSAALNPTFGAPTSTADGFTVQISNYDADYEWAATSTAGTVAIDGDLLTVSGLTSGQSATVTVTTTRTSYAGGSADVTASATVTEQTVGPVTLRITPLTSPSSCGIDELLVDSDFPSSADGVAINGLGVGVAFTLTGCSTDTLETVTVSIDFGSASPEGSVAMKIDNDGNWSPIDGATIEGSMVTYTLTDNDEVLDQDPNAGTMTDPVTVAVPFTAPVVPVPTLPGLLLGLLSSLLGLAGLGRIRQEQKKQR